MTTPEVPPYSSTTTASCIPPCRSCSSSGSSRSVSGTSTACTISAETGTSVRRSNGTAMAFLTCTMPSMSSQSAPRTGNRECPVRRASATRSAAVAVRSIAVARERGVMTSAAVWSAKPRDAVTSRAVLRSRVPASADERTNEASSAGLRAAESSSWGWMPSAISVRLATPLSSRIIGFIAMPNQRTGPAATFAVASGSDTASVLGTISPTIIENTVAISMARTEATDEAVDSDRPSVLERPHEQHPDRRAGDEAEHQGGQGDAELAGRELGREPAVRGEHRPGAGLTGVDGPLHRGPVQGDERELGRDEQGCPHGEDDAEEQQQPWGHDRSIVWGRSRHPAPRVPPRDGAGSTGGLTLTRRGAARIGA